MTDEEIVSGIQYVRFIDYGLAFEAHGEKTTVTEDEISET